MFGMSLVDSKSKSHEIRERISPILDEYNFGDVLNVILSLFLYSLEHLDMKDREAMFSILRRAEQSFMEENKELH